MIKVFVPTNNHHKLSAVRDVLSELPRSTDFELVNFEMKALERPPYRQPISWKAIYRGARYRAEGSKLERGVGYHVGIQSGLVELFSGEKTVWMDQACVYVIFATANTSTFAFAATATVPIPDEFAEKIKNGLNELGAIVEFHGKREDKDAVAFFTRGGARRKNFIADALRSAFGSLSFNEEFERRPKSPKLELVKR